MIMRTTLPSEKKSKSKETEINPTLARGIIGMMFLLLAFQVVTFTIHKCSKSTEPTPPPKQEKPAYQATNYRTYKDKSRSKSRSYNAPKRRYNKPSQRTAVRPKRDTASFKQSKPLTHNTVVYKENVRVQVDLNEADSAALIEVKGIGPYFCKKILELRERLGSFADVSQLLEIKGMDEEKLQRIGNQIFVHPSGIKKFSLAEADRKFLSRHPYIGAYNARGIALFIETMGKESCTLSNLVKNNILSPEAAEKLRPYVIEP